MLLIFVQPLTRLFMKKLFILLILASQVLFSNVNAQETTIYPGKSSRFKGLKKKNYQLKSITRVDIPFKLVNNLIVIDVIFQGIFPLKFIFDTGAENTILSKRQISDILRIPYRKEFKLIGSDMKTEIIAYLITGIQLQISDMVMPNRSMLVLDQDVLNMEEVVGANIHGILGADIFRRFIVRIDYKRRIISLYRSDTFKGPDKNYQEHPISIYRNKPYIRDTIELSQGKSLPVKLLIDSGAALPLLLHSDTDSLLAPPDNAINGKLAVGLGGYLEGYLGRVQNLGIGNFNVPNVVTSFQYLSEELDTSFLHGRNGLIGNQVLGKFDLILDYPHEKLYLRPNKYFKKEFEFDKSGLVVIASDANFRTFYIHDVIESTPAAEAGLQKGDLIKSINRIPVSFLSLNDIIRVLKKKEGKNIRIAVKRNGKKIVFNFQLRTLI